MNTTTIIAALIALLTGFAAGNAITDEPLDAEVIADRTQERFLSENPSAEEAVGIFCGILGAIAGNLALTLGARGGVFIGGGIVPKLGDYFTKSTFRARFEHNSRFGQYLAEIPTYVICSKYPALIGAAVAVKQQYSHLGVGSVSH